MSGVAIVTGGSSKIGTSIISRLEKAYKVFNPSSAECDLRREWKIQEYSKLVPVPDVLVCCAGGNKTVNNMRPKRDDCLGMDHSDLLEIFERNMFSVINTCRVFVPRMDSGSVIFIGSNIVGHPRENGEIAMYSMAKAAVHEYTLHLARAFPNLNVNCVAPDGDAEENETAKLVSFLAESKITGQIIRLNDGCPWVN
jgi:NAD(P)-dependent dehydrogenase (short-subunit alcohol dehydrogenase family)